MACEGNWLEIDTCLPFLLLVISWTFFLKKPCIRCTCDIIRVTFSINYEIASLIVKLLRGSDL